MTPTALIGVSNFADWHYRELLELAAAGEIRLCAVTIINQQDEEEKCRVLRALGCEVFADYREMLRRWHGRLALCVIPTGIHLHAAMTLAALAAGCHVLVEKPAAGSLHEVDLMRRAAQAAGRFVAVGYQHLCAPEILALKQDLLDGLVGRVRTIKCRGLWPRADSYYRRNAWAGRLKAGGDLIYDAPFNNAFAHWLNLACFFAGKRLRASAHPLAVQAELYRTRPIESACTACLRVETEEEIPLLFWLTHSCAKIEGPVLEVCGAKGSFTWTPQEIIHRRADGGTERRKVSDFFDERRHLMRAVLQRIAGQDTFFCDLTLARRQTQCAVGAFESSGITRVDEAFQVRLGSGADPVIAIRDIEQACATAFREEKLWSELELPWARPGRRIPLPPDLAIGAADAGAEDAEAALSARQEALA